MLYLHWFEWPITYDRTDHLDRVVEAGQFPLVVTAVNENTMVMKILMDGGSGINILYKDAFDKLNMDIRKLHALQSPFHGIVPRRRVMPLGTINLSDIQQCGTLPKGDTLLRSCQLPGTLQCHIWEAMLCQVHGDPELRLPQAEDARTAWRNHGVRKLP